MVSIQAHCCGADMFFDEKKAKKEYRKYVKKGPGKATKRLINQLSGFDVQNKTLIDVGGGIGAIQWWFLQQGGHRTTDIDASTGYLQLAASHAQKEAWSDKADFVSGNCTEVYDRLEDPDFITLDKVVCCYPDFMDILEKSCKKARHAIALSYPMDGLLATTMRNLAALYLSLKKNPFRPYIHPVRQIREIFSQHGFVRRQHTLAFPWHVETYVKQ